MNGAASCTKPAERNPPSSPAIDMGVDVSDAGTESDWNATAGTGSTALGAREPARPGSAARARAAVSTDPTTNHLGRTIDGERYDDGHPIARPPRQATLFSSTDDDEILARGALDGTDIVVAPRDDLDPAPLAVLARRSRPGKPPLADREPRKCRYAGRSVVGALQLPTRA